MLTKSEVDKKWSEFEKKSQELKLYGTEPEVQFQQLRDLVAELGFQAKMGYAVYAGRSSSGRYSVQFNVDGGGGYASQWPEWAFDQAKESLLNGKKLYVISNGLPFGNNLLQVLIFKYDI